MMISFLLAGLVFTFSTIVSAALPKSTQNLKPASRVKVKRPTTTENFDSQLVEGQIYRPDLSVVTGDTEANSFGVLRLRKNFDDHVKLEEVEVTK